MLGTLTRSALVGTVFLFASAGAARAENLDDLEGLDCADYISSSFGDSPLTGHLIGTGERTETWTITASVDGRIKVVNGSVAGSVTIVESYQVGYYSMSDGSTQRIDCRTYTEAR